jgi:chorismate-pyruvate lyase
MKMKLIDFKIRYIGDSNATIKTEIVDIEDDASEQEEIAQIKSHYHREVVMYESARIAQTYPNEYTIKNNNFKF